jgi:hypothetical protein
LDEDTKRKIIESLIPYISLKNAVTWGLKSSDEANEYKKILLKAN